MFKIGTRVRVKEDLHHLGGSLWGKVGTIVAASEPKWGEYTVEMDGGERRWLLFDDEFDIVENGITRALKCLK